MFYLFPNCVHINLHWHPTSFPQHVGRHSSTTYSGIIRLPSGVETENSGTIVTRNPTEPKATPTPKSDNQDNASPKQLMKKHKNFSALSNREKKMMKMKKK